MAAAILVFRFVKKIVNSLNGYDIDALNRRDELPLVETDRHHDDNVSNVSRDRQRHRDVNEDNNDAEDVSSSDESCASDSTHSHSLAGTSSSGESDFSSDSDYDEDNDDGGVNSYLPPIMTLEELHQRRHHSANDIDVENLQLLPNETCRAAPHETRGSSNGGGRKRAKSRYMSISVSLSKLSPLAYLRRRRLIAFILVGLTVSVFIIIALCLAFGGPSD